MEPVAIAIAIPLIISLLLIVLMLVLGWISRRKPESRAAAVVPWLATLFLVALGVAWFAMTAKPGS